MARALGPKRVHRYSGEFKATAVKLGRLAGVRVQDMADPLVEILAIVRKPDAARWLAEEGEPQ